MLESLHVNKAVKRIHLSRKNALFWQRPEREELKVTFVA